MGAIDSNYDLAIFGRAYGVLLAARRGAGAFLGVPLWPCSFPTPAAIGWLSTSSGGTSSCRSEKCGGTSGYRRAGLVGFLLSQVRSCDVFIYALGPDSLNSRACRAEFDYAQTWR